MLVSSMLRHRVWPSNRRRSRPFLRTACAWMQARRRIFQVYQLSSGTESSAFSNPTAAQDRLGSNSWPQKGVSRPPQPLFRSRRGAVPGVDVQRILVRHSEKNSELLDLGLSVPRRRCCQEWEDTSCRAAKRSVPSNRSKKTLI